MGNAERIANMRLALILLIALSAGISAEADLRGITIHGDSELVCQANGQGAAIGYTPWEIRPRVGQEIPVTCAFPGTLGFYQVTVSVDGYTSYLPLVGG